MPLYLTEQELAKLQSNRAPRAAQPKAKAPRERSERTGLTTLLLAGWNISYNAAMQIRLCHPDGRDTGWCDEEKDACDIAKQLTAKP